MVEQLKNSLLLGMALSGTCLLAAPAAKPTFHKDVQPILQRNCTGCHRPGEAAPMSFLTYKEIRPYAAAIKQSVSQKRMPPWNADPHVGKFANDRSLSENDLATLVNWVNTGATEGSQKDAPPAPTYAEGWSIGKPDVVLEMTSEFQVPASGTIDYHYVIIPTNFKEDTWITAAEARPMNRAVNHHIIAFVREPGSKWLKDAEANVAFVPRKEGGEGMGASEFLVGYAPGTVPEIMRPGQAKLIKAGSDIVFQLHWTTNGKAGVDRAKLGLILAKDKPKERVLTLSAVNSRFEIPAGADNHKVDSKFTLHADTVLESLFPHMHVRGKAFAMRALLPGGELRELLMVPRYDFNWQLGYYLAEPMMLPKGTQIQATGWYDNSANNKNNPDPTKAVKWGDQSWEEMMIGFFNVSVPADTNYMDVVRPKKSGPPSPSAGGQD